MEVLGAVASGIAIGEAAKVVIRIKRMWGEIEDVPDRIQSLLDYLDYLGPLLEQIDLEFRHSSITSELQHRAPVRQSIALCQRALHNLHGLAFEMEKEIGQTRALKKKFACVRVALRKDVILRLENKLEMAINLFKLSMTHYFMMTQNATNRAIQTLAQKTSRSVHVVLEEDEDDLKEQLQGLSFIRKGCGSSHLESKIYNPTIFGRIWTESAPDGSCRHWFFQPPSWLSMKVWEAELRDACSGWQKFGAIRCYNIRPASAGVFKCISDGRTDDLLGLFQTREASPFDRDDDGRSLIYYAVLYNNLRLCKTLLTMGLDICLDEKYGHIGQGSNLYRGDLTPRELTGQWNLPIFKSSNDPKYQALLQEKIAIMDLFHGVEYYHYSASDTVQLLSQGLTDSRRWKADVLSHFQQRLAPSYYRLTFRNRLEAVRKVVQSGWSETEADYPDLLRVLLKEDRQISQEDVVISIREGLSLIHTAAMGFAVTSSKGFPWQARNVSALEERSEAWNRFAGDVIKVTSAEELSEIETVQQVYNEEIASYMNSWTGTAMLTMLYAASGSLSTGMHWRSHFRECLAKWLEFLKANNVDLEEYGRRELQIYRHLQLSKCRQFQKIVADADAIWRGDTGSSDLLIELRGFEYGANSEEWELDWFVRPLQDETHPKTTCQTEDADEYTEDANIEVGQQAEETDEGIQLWRTGRLRNMTGNDNWEVRMPGSWVD